MPYSIDHPDFAKHIAEYSRWSHLGNYQIAHHLIEKFGGKEKTWVFRINSIFKPYKHKPGEQNRQSQEQYFVEQILHRKYPYKPPKKRKYRATEGKIVVVSDPHEPYSSSAVWDAIMRDDSDAEHIHINGDLGDFYSRSKFVKAQGYESFADELRITFERLEWLYANFNKVTLTLGNHDNRTEKMIAQLVPADMLWFARLNVVKYLCDFFGVAGIRVVGQRVGGQYGNVDVNFIWQLGDVVFTHIERSMEQSSSLMTKINQALIAWGGKMGLRPFNYIIQAHNHRLSIDDQGNATIFLCPMAADLSGVGLQYVLQPAMRGKPPVTGYMTLIQRDGKTDFNDIRIVRI